MPARRKVRRTGKRNSIRRHGAGFWDGVKSGLNWIKSNKVISTVGNALAPVLPIAGTIGNVASAAGWGKRKRKLGGAWRSILANGLAKGHNFIKANQLVSKGLAHFGHPKLASIASAAGYGRKRKTPKRGGGMLNYFTTEQPSAIRFN